MDQKQDPQYQRRSSKRRKKNVTLNPKVFDGEGMKMLLKLWKVDNFVDAKNTNGVNCMRSSSCCNDSSNTNNDGNGKLSSRAKVTIFTGSGISVNAGLATFSSSKSDNGLYHKAAKKFRSQKSGQEMFRYKFLKSNPTDVFDLLFDLYRESTNAQPTSTHEAIKKLEDDETTTTTAKECHKELSHHQDNKNKLAPQLLRHYTMNIDGLASACGMSIWNHKHNPSGKTVELHGSLHSLVCRCCKNVFKCDDIFGAKEAVSKSKAMIKSNKYIKKRKVLKYNKQQALCKDCDGPLRFRVLMYDDEESYLIHSTHDKKSGSHYKNTSDSTDSLEFNEMFCKDIEQSQIILFIGISFEQSASCEYFRKTWDHILSFQRRHYMGGIVDKRGAAKNFEPTKRGKKKHIFFINPDASDALFNLQTAVGCGLGDNNGDHNGVATHTLNLKSDDVFEKLLQINC